MSPQEVFNVIAELRVLKAHVEDWMTTTNEYRVSLSNKLDIITTKVNELPCKERGAIYKGYGTIFKLLWGAIGVTFGLLIAHLGWQG